MLKTLVTMAVTALLCTAVYAAETGTSAAGGKDRGERRQMRGPGEMFAGLNLTDEQKAQVKEILDAAHEKAKAADTPEAKRDIMKAAHEKIRNTVLTEEQRKKMDEKRADQAGGGKGPFGAGLMERLEKLNLTADQKEKVRAILEDAHKKIINEVLTPEQRDQLTENRQHAGQGRRGPHTQPAK